MFAIAYPAIGGDLTRHSLVGGTEAGDASSDYAWEFDLASRHRPGRQGVAYMWVSNRENYEDHAGGAFGDLDAASGSPTTGGTASGQTVHRARLYWSKFQEPEHTTLGNAVDVGNASGIGGGSIVGLAALREALLILKRDGVFMLTADQLKVLSKA